jgi:hypothetical protein
VDIRPTFNQPSLHDGITGEENGGAGDEVLRWLRTRREDALYQTVERMRKNFYHLWKVLDELYLAPRSDPSKLEAWRSAEEGSQEWRKARFHDQAVDILMRATS